jgi:hypothetical protein
MFRTQFLITVTGADERVSIGSLVALARSNPLVEIGLLYTATPEGRNRYPGLSWLREAAAALSGRCAIHVCGSGARRRLLEGDLLDLVRHAPRVQVNGAVTVQEASLLAAMVDELITQHNPNNAHLLDVAAPNHSLLVDGSGGRGISPQSWVRPDTVKNVGFAGGLGPDNLAGELEKISRVAGASAWVDMEGRLRTADDWFDIGLARRAVDVFTAATTAPTPTTAPRRAAVRP